MEPAEQNKYVRLTASKWPEAEDGLLVAAFAGWNDAGESATKAVSFLGQQIGAATFANIDPEDFYVFTDTRPRVRLANGKQRELSWPTNEFAIQPNTGDSRRVITLVGVEPNLKWQTFTDAIFAVAQRCHVSEVVLLGALVAPVPHTRAVPLTGYTVQPDLQDQMRQMGIHPSYYEGPTGILGVLNDYCKRNNISCSSVWGAAPSYLSANPNWKVTSALLKTVNELFDLNLDLTVVQNRSRQFENEVSAAVERDTDVQNFVSTLESRYDNDDEDLQDSFDLSGRHEHEDENELPSADIIIRELEQQLGLRPHNPDEEK